MRTQTLKFIDANGKEVDPLDWLAGLTGNCKCYRKRRGKWVEILPLWADETTKSSVKQNETKGRKRS